MDFRLLTNPLAVTFSNPNPGGITIPCCELLDDNIIEEDETIPIVIGSVPLDFLGDLDISGDVGLVISDDDSKEKSYEKFDLILMI